MATREAQRGLGGPPHGRGTRYRGARNNCSDTGRLRWGLHRNVAFKARAMREHEQIDLA